MFASSRRRSRLVVVRVSSSGTRAGSSLPSLSAAPLAQSIKPPRASREASASRAAIPYCQRRREARSRFRETQEGVIRHEQRSVLIKAGVDRGVKPVKSRRGEGRKFRRKSRLNFRPSLCLFPTFLRDDHRARAFVGEDFGEQRVAQRAFDDVRAAHSAMK